MNDLDNTENNLINQEFIAKALMLVFLILLILFYLFIKMSVKLKACSRKRYIFSLKINNFIFRINVEEHNFELLNDDQRDYTSQFGM